MERCERTLIKHTNYIYEYINFIDEESINSIEKILSEEIESYDPDLKYLNGTRSNRGWNLGSFKGRNKKINEVNQYLEKVGYGILSQYYRDCPLVKSYHSPNGSIGSAMTYRLYNKNDQYNWHTDTTDGFRLLVSLIIYLNDDFKGGETLFLNDRLKIKPNKGSVLMFPCGPYFVHKSTPIKSGKKSIIWDCYFDIPKSLSETLREPRDK